MTLIWTRTAELTLVEILEYIQTDFGILVAEKYYQRIMETLQNIKVEPTLFPIYQSNAQVRKAVIEKKTVVYYQISDEAIYLLAFYDVRKGTHRL